MFSGISLPAVLGSIGTVVVGGIIGTVTVLGVVSNQVNSAGDNPGNSSSPSVNYGSNS